MKITFLEGTADTKGNLKIKIPKGLPLCPIDASPQKIPEKTLGCSCRRLVKD